MMTAVKRQTALKNIASVVPSTVFDRFIAILTTIEERTNDALVYALGETSTDPTHNFTYVMNRGEHVEEITPIREILDLFEGWFITSNSIVTPDELVLWEVYSIIERK